uniref:Uncharacterized protein n=1 Tax=Fagus sylvatica TaxID=28930 RepID=A0A2N9HGX8_FAGSY
MQRASILPKPPPCPSSPSQKSPTPLVFFSQTPTPFASSIHCHRRFHSNPMVRPSFSFMNGSSHRPQEKNDKTKKKEEQKKTDTCGAQRRSPKCLVRRRSAARAIWAWYRSLLDLGGLWVVVWGQQHDDGAD